MPGPRRRCPLSVRQAFKSQISVCACAEGPTACRHRSPRFSVQSGAASRRQQGGGRHVLLLPVRKKHFILIFFNKSMGNKLILVLFCFLGFLFVCSFILRIIAGFPLIILGTEVTSQPIFKFYFLKKETNLKFT